MRKCSLLFIILFLLQVTILFGQDFYDMKYVSVTGKVTPGKAAPGATIDITITAEIEPGFHINSNKPNEEYLIPTIIKFEPLENASYGKVDYPEPKLATFSFSEESMAVYEGKVTFHTKLTLSDKFSPGKFLIKGVFSYQACNDQNCFAPAEESFEIPFEVVAGVAATTAEKIAATPLEQPAQQIEEQETSAPSVRFTADELKAKRVIEKGLPYAMLAFFIFGLALNLTPCVYPVIPLTVGYFGGQSGRSKGSSFIMALFYVFGIAIIVSHGQSH